MSTRGLLDGRNRTACAATRGHDTQWDALAELDKKLFTYIHGYLF